jgi:glucose 1-dehydrogenase
VTSSGFAPHPPAARLLEGRRALVTGATSGIGQAVAWELAAHGAAVAVGYRSDPDTAAEMVAEMTGAGCDAAAIHLDVSSEDSVRTGFARATTALGAIDVVVCNAGVESPSPLVEMSLDQWRSVIDVNLTGTFLCSREAAQGMIAAGRGGVIIGVTSVHDRMPWADFSHYSASKGGQKLFFESIAKELAPHGIRVVAVAPGAIATPINQDMLEDAGERAAVERQIPMGRVGEAPEVARVTAWLASDGASYVTGATLVVDGGMTLYPPDAG